MSLRKSSTWIWILAILLAGGIGSGIWLRGVRARVRTLRLSDGTTVYFRSGTTVTPAAGFPQPRELQVNGEIFLVVSAAPQPLVVRSRLLRLTATGAAAMRITAFANETGEQAEVLSGQVVARKAYPSADLIPDTLTGGQMVMVNQTIDLMEKEQDDPEATRKWSEAFVRSAKPLSSTLPSLTAGAGDGDYLVKPPYAPAPEPTPRAAVPKGRVEHFLLKAADSKFYPNTGRRGTTPTRSVTVYIPSQYVPGTAAPLLLAHDAMGARNNQLPAMLDDLIAAHRLPPIVAVMVASGGGDGGGSERGLEYDTVSGKYAEFIEAEVLPKVARDYHVTFTPDPDGRATMGGSSGGAAAFSMAWFHPDLYRRVLTYSGTYKNNQSPKDPAFPHGAWEYHEHLIPQSTPKPLRVWLEVGEKDHGATDPEEMHNTVLANLRMAAELKAKGYHCQFVFAEGAGHVDRRVVAQTLPQALEWLWQGYRPAP